MAVRRRSCEGFAEAVRLLFWWEFHRHSRDEISRLPAAVCLWQRRFWPAAVCFWQRRFSRPTLTRRALRIRKAPFPRRAVRPPLPLALRACAELECSHAVAHGPRLVRGQRLMQTPVQRLRFRPRLRWDACTLQHPHTSKWQWLRSPAEGSRVSRITSVPSTGPTYGTHESLSPNIRRLDVSAAHRRIRSRPRRPEHTSRDTHASPRYGPPSRMQGAKGQDRWLTPRLSGNLDRAWDVVRAVTRASHADLCARECSLVRWRAGGMEFLEEAAVLPGGRPFLRV